jgi:myo-inositol-1(or 4)-monophosphatase
MNYSHGVDYCGISIGIESNSELIGGVIFLPSRDELYYSLEGEGAYRNNTEISVSSIENISDSLVEVDVNRGNIDDINGKLKTYENIINKSQGMRAIRAAVGELTSLADGRIDIIYDSLYHPWDMAAGISLIREAGGEVYARESGSTDWSDLKSEEQVIATNGEFSYEELVKEFEP